MGGTARDGAVWPSGKAGTAGLTLWICAVMTGLLLAKTDASSAAVTSPYDLARRRSTRTWARGVVTTYASSPATGDLPGTTFSDGTAPVAYTHDRRGRVATVVEGSGRRSFTYTPSGRVADETITCSGATGLPIRPLRNYDSPPPVSWRL